MADALVWSDELPEETDSTLKQYFIVLLQMRTRAVLSDIDSFAKDILDDINATAPKWAFCEKERIDAKWQPLFFELRAKSQSELEAYCESVREQDGCEEPKQ